MKWSTGFGVNGKRACGDFKIIGILFSPYWIWILMCWTSPLAQEVIVICKRIIMDRLCVCTLWWHHCSFKRFVQQLITHLKTRCSYLSLTFTSKEPFLSVAKKGKKKHPATALSERHVVLFQDHCVILCDCLWTGTAAAADNWNKEPKENKKVLPEADSTREKE